MSQKKEINFEINLLPVISLLAVCISFLLLTTVWIKIGTLDVTQALGDSTALTQRESPAIWVIIDDSGDIIFQLKNMANQKKKQFRFVKQSDANYWSRLEGFTTSLKKDLPELQTALVFPDRLTEFDHVIKTIDLLKKSEIKDVGIAPL